jgi:hypothetical protein
MMRNIRQAFCSVLDSIGYLVCALSTRGARPGMALPSVAVGWMVQLRAGVAEAQGPVRGLGLRGVTNRTGDRRRGGAEQAHGLRVVRDEPDGGWGAGDKTTGIEGAWMNPADGAPPVGSRRYAGESP